jgi:hypothetical protein
MTTVDDALAALKTRYGARWEVWIVPLMAGDEVWCARRHDNHRMVLNAYEPRHLAEYIAEAEEAQEAG